MRKLTTNDVIQLGVITAVCILLSAVVTTQWLHVRQDLVYAGPSVLFLLYLLLAGRTPIPGFDARLLWVVSIVITTLIEIWLASAM